MVLLHNLSRVTLVSIFGSLCLLVYFWSNVHVEALYLDQYWRRLCTFTSNITSIVVGNVDTQHTHELSNLNVVDIGALLIMHNTQAHTLQGAVHVKTIVLIGQDTYSNVNC